MAKRVHNDLTREDFVNALREKDTFVDITVDDLMQIYSRAETYASMRKTENVMVAKLMAQPVVTIPLYCSLSDAAHLMIQHKISGIPVVDDEECLAGIITEADFLRAIGVPSHHPAHNLWQTLENMFSHHVEIRDPVGIVSELMSRDLVTVTREQTLHDVLDVMKKNRVKRVIVVDLERRVVGMITRSDLVRVFFDRIRGDV